MPRALMERYQAVRCNYGKLTRLLKLTVSSSSQLSPLHLRLFFGGVTNAFRGGVVKADLGGVENEALGERFGGV